MKILFVNKFLYYRGGAETYLLKLGSFFEKNGHQVMYFGMNDEKNIVGNAWKLGTKNVDFHSNGIQRIWYPFKIIYSFEAYRKMIELIKNFQPDIIHLNNINFQLTPSIIDAAWKMGVPVVQTVHDSQMVCPGHLLYQPDKNEVCLKCLHGSKWNCLRYRCIHRSAIKSFLGVLEGFLYDRKKNYDRVRLYICPSRFMESILLTRKRYKGKTIILHNFIELPDRCYGEKESYILFFGRLSKEKGIEMFLDICRKFPSEKFKIAGDGPLKETCLGIENVEYLGLLTGDKLKQAISKAKFVIYPSICYENCPLSILEALSLGTPVISSSRGGSAELIEDGRNGILVKETFTLDKLENAVRSLLNNPELLKRMTEYCLESREQFLTLEKYGKELEEIYRQILKE